MYDVLNTNNNDEIFWELKRVFRETFEINTQEVFIGKYLNFRIVKLHLGFIINQTGHIMELVYEWFTDGNFQKFDAPLQTEYSYEKELMNYVPLVGDSLRKYEH